MVIQERREKIQKPVPPALQILCQVMDPPLTTHTPLTTPTTYFPHYILLLCQPHTTHHSLYIPLAFFIMSTCLHFVTTTQSSLPCLLCQLNPSLRSSHATSYVNLTRKLCQPGVHHPSPTISPPLCQPAILPTVSYCTIMSS